MALLPGEKLGRYEILASIGAGGMGEVYRARDLRLNREVAIKVSAAQFSERFEREAQAIAALNHRHICTLHDVGPNFLVMEYIDGKPLEGPLALDRALRYALQICEALEEAHRKGITHRDLKPGNILVTESGVKLLDFGLARVAALPTAASATAAMPRTEAGVMLGTAAYMSPEQAKGEEADARSDIFSFGVVLYEMLSGRRAFERGSAIETITATLRDEPEPLQAPSTVSAVVTRCLRKSPGERFQTMSEVRIALERAANQPAEKVPSIAVLPFVNMSAEKENEYFSDGLTEEILNLLAKIPGLKVTARTSSFAFRGKDQDITKIAEALRVDNVLEGSVRRAGNRVRVTAQLIQASDGTHLWSERYDRDLTDVFAIQDEIGQAISEALQVRLAPRTKAVNIEAWQLYLKGEYWRLRNNADSLEKAKECYEQALRIEPNYANAYNGLATYYYNLTVLGLRPVGEMAPLAKAAARKALELDPTCSESHLVTAIIGGAMDYDWALAERHFLKALTIKPVTARPHYCYAVFYLQPHGRNSEALEHVRMAMDKDPLSMLMYFGVAMILFCARDFRQSMEAARRGLEIDPNAILLLLAMGFAQMGSELADKAVATFTHLVEVAPWWRMSEMGLAAALSLAGDTLSSEELAQRSMAKHGHHIGTAIYYATAGNADAMFAALEEARQKRDVFCIQLPYFCFFDQWHGDPRYQALLERMRLA
jgi:eukaryotic-like serine/threonine-protein kinase